MDDNNIWRAQFHHYLMADPALHKLSRLARTMDYDRQTGMLYRVSGGVEGGVGVVRRAVGTSEVKRERE